MSTYFPYYTPKTLQSPPHLFFPFENDTKGQQRDVRIVSCPDKASRWHPTNAKWIPSYFFHHHRKKGHYFHSRSIHKMHISLSPIYISLVLSSTSLFSCNSAKLRVFLSLLLLQLFRADQRQAKAKSSVEMVRRDIRVVKSSHATTLGIQQPYFLYSFCRPSLSCDGSLPPVIFYRF